MYTGELKSKEWSSITNTRNTISNTDKEIRLWWNVDFISGLINTHMTVNRHFSWNYVYLTCWAQWWWQCSPRAPSPPPWEPAPSPGGSPPTPHPWRTRSHNAPHWYSSPSINPSFPCLLRRDEIETEQKNAHHFYFRDDKNFTDCYQSSDPHWASIKYNSGDYFIHYIGRTAGSMDYHNLAGGHNICCRCRCVCAEELQDPADCSLMSGCVHLKC